MYIAIEFRKSLSDKSFKGICESNFLDVLSGYDNVKLKEEVFLVQDIEYKGISGKFKNKNEHFFLELYLSAGTISCRFDGKLTDEIIVVCNDIAGHLDAKLFWERNELMSQIGIDNAILRYNKQKNKPVKQQYLKESFGQNLWFSIKGEITEVIDYFNLKIQSEVTWGEGLKQMNAYQGIFLFQYKGWVFLAGALAENIFAPFPRGDKRIEKHQREKLLQWGQIFKDVQYYMYADRPAYIRALYRIKNGKLLYGSFYTESHQFNQGKLSKKDLEKTSGEIETIGSSWSYAPDDFLYMEEMKNAKALVVELVKFDAPRNG